ncbi:nucleolar protein 56-like [Crassostrea virginica]|uniref:Nucleolar protein 56 n=1 Tax=Crassostrea virginica TaxID=6565 RepID=A0A8B8EY31_CRAVI|nr:nucleolar protein 56-like [Crassostrea virginica]
MPQSLFVLFEHASGYGLFRVKEFEEVATFIPEVERSTSDVSKFQSIVKLSAFAPFKSGTNALDNMNSISEGLLHDDLQVFLESNVPKGGKKEKVVLGVSDAKIGAAITEELGIKCSHIGVVPEVIRGIRLHFPNMVKGLTEVSSGKAQLGLGHSYSRAKVKFNVNRADNMIIQSISLMDQLDKNINTFSMRIREWYSYHFPELVKIISDNYLYAKVVRLVGNRKEFTEDSMEQLEELVMDSGKAQAILDASRSSMGMDISPIDLLNIEAFTSKVISLTEYRRGLAEYLRSKMKQVAPNLGTLIGDQVGARLIAHAGSLTNLAKYPASTVQILGAEKALFRAIKTKGNTPKYGLIFHSTFIGRAGAKNKGRISRYLANKCSIASRIDCFSEIPTQVFGDHLKQQVEDRLKFLDTGEAPQKNIDVMKEALQEASVVQAKIAKKEKKKKKKEKRKSAADETLDTTQEAETTQEMDVSQEEEPKKKKKKGKRKSEGMDTTQEMETTQEEEEEPPKKKKKKPKVEAEEEEQEEDLSKKKKKKKKKE